MMPAETPTPLPACPERLTSGFYWCQVQYETGKQMKLLRFTEARTFHEHETWADFDGKWISSHSITIVEKLMPPTSRRVTPDAGVREALQRMAKQKSRAEMDEDDIEHADFEGAYFWFVEMSRDTLARIDAALASTPPQVKTDAGAWRTMESAPRDGTDVLTYSPSYGMNTFAFEEGKWWSVDGERCPTEGGQGLTHWQPLPAPPQVTP